MEQTNGVLIGAGGGVFNSQIEFALKNMTGATREQFNTLVSKAFQRNSSIVLGGSRIRAYFRKGTFRPDSDLDVGFGNLSKSQARKVIDQTSRMGPLELENTIIVPGNKTPNIPEITTPEEFFQRTGVRSDPGRIGETFTPSGSITFTPDGAIHINPPN